MAGKVKKTAHYRYANRVRGKNTQLGTALEKCRANIPASGIPEFSIGNDTVCAVVKCQQLGNREFLHLVTYEQGAGAAVIEMLGNGNIDEEPAPSAKEYIISQMFLICSKNHVLWCGHNAPIRDTGINNVLNCFLDAFWGDGATPEYLLVAKIDDTRLGDLLTEGIARIDLGAGSYRDTLEYVRNSGRIPSAGLFSILSSFGTADITDELLDASEDVIAHVSLNPKKSWKKDDVRTWLASFASDVISTHDDGFVIETKNGLRITQDSIRLKKSLEVEGSRLVINLAQIRSGLFETLDEFERLDVLEN